LGIAAGATTLGAPSGGHPVGDRCGVGIVGERGQVAHRDPEEDDGQPSGQEEDEKHRASKARGLSASLRRL